MDQQLVLGILIGILVLVSAFQAFQLAELSGKVQVMGVGLASGSYSAPAGNAQQTGQQVALPAGIANAPDMVGGC